MSKLQEGDLVRDTVLDIVGSIKLRYKDYGTMVRELKLENTKVLKSYKFNEKEKAYSPFYSYYRSDVRNVVSVASEVRLELLQRPNLEEIL